ncbi:MAG: RDD family protein [Acidimicrobiaceae bacterium]|nr:RDD family protein [Acidimicrobiaceae bacterium]
MTSAGPWPPLGRPAVILDAATPFRRFAALLIDGLVSSLTLGIGWLIWLAFVLRRGQTPGKQVLGLVAAYADGTPFGWGRTLAREVLKNFFWCVTFGIGFIVDALVMLLGDDEGRSVTDRLIGSRIVNSPPS